MHSDFGLPAQGPECSVWNHLHSGLDLARAELDVLSSGERLVVESVATFIAVSRSKLTARADVKPAILYQKQLLANPWFRHATDIEFASEAISRACQTLDRYAELEPVISEYSLGERPAEYLAEVAQTFLFGFDAACIALAGATIEQVLKELLVKHGVYSETTLKAERPAASHMLDRAHREKIVHSSFRQARVTLNHRNEVMHSHLWKPEIRRQIALTCIAGVLALLAEVQ